jgi:hypothetical protein
VAKWDKPITGPGAGGGGQPIPFDTGVVPSNPIYGSDPSQAGVVGESNHGPGVRGRSVREYVADLQGSGASDGVLGESPFGNGLHGISQSAGASGVWGENKAGGAGVSGSSTGGYGVAGETTSDYQADPKLARPGVFGLNYGTGAGILGASDAGDGVWGVTFANDHAGVSAVNYGGGIAVFASASGGGVASSTAVEGNTDDGTGVRGSSNTGVGVEGSGGLFAGRFFGKVGVVGDHEISGSATIHGSATVGGDIVLTGGDCAEHFDAAEAEELEPGTVVVIGEDGCLRASRGAYDKKVVGVISGAGEYKPAIVLDTRASEKPRALVALIGKVYCKVDAQSGPIQVGDLLTASPSRGHAMKANEPDRAFGAVIGKALGSLSSGRGLIPILVALQ